MIGLDDLEKGIKLQKQIELLGELIAEKKGTTMDSIRRAILPDKYENIQIGLLEVLLGEKNKALRELKEKCQKQ